MNTQDLWIRALQVGGHIPPLWDLPNYVAVNPFLGFTNTPFEVAAARVGDGLGAKVLPGVDFYQERWKKGDFDAALLGRAAQRLGEESHSFGTILAGDAPMTHRTSSTVPTFAERHDQQFGTQWEEALVRQITRWCAVYAQGGGTYWKVDLSQGLFASWREAAQVDRTLEILGLPQWRSWVSSLPADPAEALALALDQGAVASDDLDAYLYRLLAGVYGWSSFFRRESWSEANAHPRLVAELLAIRACADAVVRQDWQARLGSDALSHFVQPKVEDEATRLVFQEALEDGFAQQLISKFKKVDASHLAERKRPAVQAVFCIDVRSEPMRRHLEAQHASIETRGFAGFFGVSIDWKESQHQHGSARCPVLLKPAVTVRAEGQGTPVEWKRRSKPLQAAPASAFSFVELLGLSYGLGLAKDVLGQAKKKASPEHESNFGLESGDAPLADAAKINIAAGIIKNLGLRDRVARIVLLCGHESHSANNLHAAGLDCGACGGHGGAINARVAADLLNNPSVRHGLSERGVVIPSDTIFVAGVHDTSVDRVTLLDVDRVPETHRSELGRLGEWLAAAGTLVRAERAESLDVQERRPSLLELLLSRRSKDWSEVRPEWGLARNAAFIAARRDRTRGVDLGARAFLHEYDATTDEDSSILTLILSAPMVVASWINLQYFASTVDNDMFGCGTKTIHNGVGNLGVVLGNGGDLRTGLAKQSVHNPDGTWFHEPLRLQVIVEADPTKIDDVLEAQPAVRELVENGWVRLFTLDPEGCDAWLRTREGQWEPVSIEGGVVSSCVTC